MPLGPLDDFLGHQTPDTFDHVYSGERHFYDRHYFNMHASSDELFMIAGMGQYPNLGTTDVFASISVGDTIYVVRASRELGSDRMNTVIGPFGIEVIEGLKTLHLWLEPNEWGIEFDLTYNGAVEALEEPKFFGRAPHGRVTTEGTRFAQVGTYTGTLKVAGRTYDVTPDKWKGARDHSWGIRPVGDPEPPGISAKYAATAGGFHNWIPAQFDDYMMKFFIQENSEGVRTHEEAARVWNLDKNRPIESLGRPEHNFTYISGTRELEKAVISFTSPSGEPMTMTNTPQRTVYLSFGSGYGRDPEWIHGQYHGDLVVQGLQADVSTQAARSKLAGLNETLCRFELSTGEVGWGMHENSCRGIFKPYGFTSAESVAP